MVFTCIRTKRIILLSNLTSHSLGLLDRDFKILLWRSNTRRTIILAITGVYSPISLATLNKALAYLVP
jgi:hypothetical protein